MKSKIDTVDLTPSEKEDIDRTVREEIRQIDAEIADRKSSFFHSLKDIVKKKK